MDRMIYLTLYLFTETKNLIVWENLPRTFWLRICKHLLSPKRSNSIVTTPKNRWQRNRYSQPKKLLIDWTISVKHILSVYTIVLKRTIPCNAAAVSLCGDSLFNLHEIFFKKSELAEHAGHFFCYLWVFLLITTNFSHSLPYTNNSFVL